MSTQPHSTQSQHKAAPHPAKAAPAYEEHDPAEVPLSVQVALREAIRLEKVSPLEYQNYLWLIAQESTGKVNARNSKSTARGLFQLMRAQYGLNPHGEKSFGNAVEECQGGIRYVVGRYRTAAAAREFWQRKHWY